MGYGGQPSPIFLESIYPQTKKNKIMSTKTDTLILLLTDCVRELRETNRLLRSGAIASKKQSTKKVGGLTLTSRCLKLYFEEKKANVGKIILIRSGIFFHAYFDDAKWMSDNFGLKICDVAKDGEQEILSVGFPVSSQGKYEDKIKEKGREPQCILETRELTISNNK